MWHIYFFLSRHTSACLCLGIPDSSLALSSGFILVSKSTMKVPKTWGWVDHEKNTGSRAKTRRQSLALFYLCWEHPYQATRIFWILYLENDHGSAICLIWGLQIHFQGIDEFINIESVNNEDCMDFWVTSRQHMRTVFWKVAGKRLEMGLQSLSFTKSL